MRTIPTLWRDLAAAFLLLALPALLALLVVATGHAYLSRHSAARDLPWCRMPEAAAVAAGEPLNHVLSDKLNLHVPDTVFAHRLAARAEWPLWNPEILGGLPHAANPLTAVNHPVNLLMLLVAPLDAIALAAAVQLFLAGLFTFLFLRMAGLAVLPALTGGLGFMFSGWCAARLHNPQIVAVAAWLPLGLFALEARFRGHRRWSLMLLSVAVAMMALGGFPQIAVLGGAALAVHALLALGAEVGRRPPRLILRRAALVLAFALIGLLLAAVQVLPTLDLMRASGHSGRSEGDLVLDRLRPAALLGAVLPGALGDPMRPVRWDEDWAVRIASGEVQADGVVRAPASMNWSERTFYPGLVLLLLAPFGVLVRPRRVALSLAVLGAGGLVLAMAPAVIRATAGLPTQDVGAPSRAIVLTAFAIPCLAALGLERLLHAGPVLGPALRRWALRFGAAALALLAVLVLAAFAVEDWTLLRGIEVLKRAGVEARLGVAEPRPAAAYRDALRPAFHDLRADLLRALLVLGALALGPLLRRRLPVRPLAFAAGFVALVLADLLSVFVPPNLPVTKEALFERTPAIAFLDENLGTDRILRVSTSSGQARAEADALFVPDLPVLYGLRDAQGWRELVPERQLRLWEGVSALVRPVGFAGIPASEADSPIVDLARVRYLVAAAPVEALAAREVHPRGRTPADLYLYENPDPLPLAYLAHEVKVLGDDDARRALREGRVDPRRTLVLAEDPDWRAEPAPAAETLEQVAVEHVGANDLRFRVHPSAPGFLVVTEAWDAGWRAKITSADGEEEAPVLRAMTAFRAVPVAAREQVVHLYYDPPSWTRGVVLSGVGLIAFVLLPLVGPRRPRALAPPPSGSDQQGGRAGGEDHAT